MTKKLQIIIFFTIFILILLNIIFSVKATKECMYDYLLACKKYWYCRWKIYDLKNYNDGQTAWHIVHDEENNFLQNKDILQMKNNKVIWCLHYTDNVFQDIVGTVQCADVWLYLKIEK